MKKIINILLVVTAFMPVLNVSAAQQRPCPHQHTVSIYSHSNYTQLKSNPSFHTETKYFDKQCTNCRATITKNSKGASKTETHSFKGNKCTDCGFTNTNQFINPKNN